jgi:Ni/Fe-hydrogenase subunit HybB-like protein
MQLTTFFTDSPLWVSIPITLGYLAVAIVIVILLVRLFRMKL